MIYTEINSTDYSSKIPRDSISIPDTLNERNQISFEIIGSATDRPSIGQEVIMWRTSSKTTKVYAGIIHDLTEREHGGYLLWNVDCVGYEKILDRFRAPESYTDKTCGYIIKDLLSQFVPAAESITSTNVEDGPTMDEVILGYEWKISDVLNRLSEITGYFWHIDYDKDLHFEDRTKNDAPFDIDDDSTVYEFEVSKTLADYRNQQYTIGGLATSSSVSDSFVGDGEQRTFHVRRPIAEEPTISINGTPVSSSDIGILDVETDKKYYWAKGETAIIQDDGEAVLTDTDTIEIDYKYLYPYVAFAEDGAEINSRSAAESNSGKYQNAESRKSVNDSDQLQKETIGLLEKYGTIPETITYYTFENGLEAGQLQNIVRTNHNIDDDYLITEVTLEPKGWDDGTFKFWYHVTAALTDYQGGWIEFFRKLADKDKDFVIRDNEVLIKLKVMSDNLTISESLSTDTDGYDNRIDYARVDFSEIGKNVNLIGLTETYAHKTVKVNGEGLTDAGEADTDYDTYNIAGVTASFDTDLNDYNVIGLTDPAEAETGALWVWVKGISSPYD